MHKIYFTVFAIGLFYQLGLKMISNKSNNILIQYIRHYQSLKWKIKKNGKKIKNNTL